MKRRRRKQKLHRGACLILGMVACVSVLFLAGRLKNVKEDPITGEEAQTEEAQIPMDGPPEESAQSPAGETQAKPQASAASGEEKPQGLPSTAEGNAEIQTETADWSSYFDGKNGAAVIYDSAKNRCIIYNEELANTRRSPCSTFKIVSSLIALEQGVIVPEDSVRAWSGETFWNGDWNRDIGFDDAFRTSCVWYFREVVDDIGEARMQEALEQLNYGNCDISDWEGRQNTNNQNPALTGFWIESSLKISPKEQTEVLERIFGEDSIYSEETVNHLKQVMLQPEEDGTQAAVYGKTGMGKAQGVTVDAWFAGFAKQAEDNIYFCVYLGETKGEDISSTAAKNIAVSLVMDYCKNR